MPRKRKLGSSVIIGSVTWEQALQGFLFHKQTTGISSSTLDDYRRFSVYFFTRYPDVWGSSTMQDAVVEYMSEKIKPSTFNLRLVYLGSFFEWSVNEGYLPENPMKQFKRRKAQSRIVQVPEDTLQRLLTLPDQTTWSGLRDYALLLLALDTGIRPKEALSLTIKDLDLTHGLVNISAATAKTRVARSLPILPPVASAIDTLVRSRHPAWRQEVPVFCSENGTPLTRHTWGDRLEYYSQKLGVKIRPYDLRHSFALLFLRGGGHAFGLQRMLGHTDMSMTRRYVNLTGDDLQKIHDTASPLNRIAPKKQRVRKIKS